MKNIFLLVLFSFNIQGSDLPNTLTKCFDDTPFLKESFNSFLFSKDIDLYNHTEQEMERVVIFQPQSLRDKSKRFTLTTTIDPVTVRMIKKDDQLSVTKKVSKKILILSSKNGHQYTLYCKNGCSQNELSKLAKKGLTYSAQRVEKVTTCLDFAVEGV